MKKIAETENYVVIQVPGNNEGQKDWESAMKGILNQCEELHGKGYRPLHYVPRVSGWVCQKLTRKQQIAA